MRKQPEPAPEFDQFAQTYDDTLAAQLAFFDNENEYFARYKVELALQRFGATPARILDFGCGVGRSVALFQELAPGAEMFGCDVSPMSIEVATRRHPTATFSSPQESRAQDVDLILAACVFHHIPPAERAANLDWCRQKLRPGGMLFIVEHNPFNPVTRRMVDTCEFDEDAILLTKNETRSLVRAAGFAVESDGYTLFFPGPLKVLRPLERGMEWLPLGGQHYVAGRKPPAV